MHVYWMALMSSTVMEIDGDNQAPGVGLPVEHLPNANSDFSIIEDADGENVLSAATGGALLTLSEGLSTYVASAVEVTEYPPVRPEPPDPEDPEM